MDPKALFLSTEDPPFARHVECLRADRASYAATLLLLLENGVDLGLGARVRSLAAAWALRDHELAENLLSRPAWNPGVVARALELLDAGRVARSLRKRLARLEAEKTARPKKRRALRARLRTLEREGSAGSLSGALARHVRRWLARVPQEQLSLFALGMPSEPWRNVADLVHPRPASLQAPWFLSHAYGEELAGDALLTRLRRALPAELASLAREHRVPWAALRLQGGNPSPELRAAVSRYESLDHLLWYYEELRCPELDATLARRLGAGEQPSFGVGKLMERTLTLRDLKAPCWPHLVRAADRALAKTKLSLEPPVVVLGDASSSMNVAIRTATIVGSVLTVLTQAQLRFFNAQHVPTPLLPSDTSGVLFVTDRVKAEGNTSPAAALEPSLRKRELVRSFVVVTDEEENTHYKGELFDAMLARYRKECFPARVTFVSFLRKGTTGSMVRALQLRGIPVRQFCLDSVHPDLTRLDTILGELAVEGAPFAERVSTLSQRLALPGASLAQALADAG